MGGAWHKWGLTIVSVSLLGSAAVTTLGARANIASDDKSTSAVSSERQTAGTVPLVALPAEAQQTMRSIRSGGPFPYSKDGIVFGNREQILPRRPRGFYHEYTVRTPGSTDRGARRIVCGGRELREPETCFFTEDHYASFRRIVP